MRLDQGGAGFQRILSAANPGEMERMLKEKECNQKNAEILFLYMEIES